MQKLIKDGKIINDYWVLVKEATNPTILKALPGRNLIVPLHFWKMFPDELSEYNGNLAIWIDSDKNIATIWEEVQNFPLIALNFPVFSDGRSYTNARELRESFGYTGEIRAIGDVLRDQLYYLSRCGFSEFAMRYDQNLEECLLAFNDFHTGYQSDTKQPLPLFRRRTSTVSGAT